MSADPLGVHSPGEADLNLYAYVSAAVLAAIDPVGLNPSILFRGKPGEAISQAFADMTEFFYGGNVKQTPDKVQYEQPKGGPGGVVGGAVAVVTARLGPIEKDPNEMSKAGMRAGAEAFGPLDSGEKLILGTDVTGAEVDRAEVAVEFAVEVALGALALAGGRLVKSGCFVAGTAVWTRNGLASIESLQPGDLVLAMNDETGELAWAGVEEAFERWVEKSLDLDLQDANGLAETLGVTAEHPFWGPDGWVPAGDLRPDDRVWSVERGWLWVRSIHERYEDVPVYNVSVASEHTYFVGELGAWVHNPGCGGNAKQAKKFGSGRSAHSAKVTIEREGKVVSQEKITSGNMTPEEAELGFPQSSLATHTEARAVEKPLQPGDKMTIESEQGYAPCPTCKGKMNKKAAESGASIEYKWEDKTWEAGKGKGKRKDK